MQFGGTAEYNSALRHWELIRSQEKGVGVRVVSLLAADLLAQESADVHHLRRETAAAELLPHARHAQQVPMILLHRAHLVVANLVHVEEADAKALPGDSAHLLDSGLHSFQR